MTMADLKGSRLARSRWFANTIGEFLVRIHFRQFDDIILSPSYPKLDRTKRHSQFGYRFAAEHIEFKFNAELLHRIFNEGMKTELRELVG